MAGSYIHIIEGDGSLSSNEGVNGMLENGGDVYEAIEQMYGMIWYLATRLSPLVEVVPEFLISEAMENYRYGIRSSPTREG